MAKYALLNFKINNDFFDWEKAFYSSQPMARQAGLLELFHAKEVEDSIFCSRTGNCKFI